MAGVKQQIIDVEQIQSEAIAARIKEEVEKFRVNETVESIEKLPQ